jgi:YegS/Rv2252/BmrU family lipid kinase
MTQRQGDGERLAREAAEQGATRLVVAGGDGTVSEALSGLRQSERGAEVELVLLPLGTGRDFARSLGLGTDLGAAVARLDTGWKRKIDAGRVRCRTASGGERLRSFMNVASIGLSASAARWLEEWGQKHRRGPLSYVLSGVKALARYPMPPVRIKVDGVVVHSGRLGLAAVCNGQYFAGGMHVAPEAIIDDGLFDVVIVRGMSMIAALGHLPKLMAGRHIGDPRVSLHRGVSVEAESDEEVWLEADGEPVGTLPARIELLPGAVQLAGLPEGR